MTTSVLREEPRGPTAEAAQAVLARHSTKLQAKLRMIADGSSSVNRLRAEHASAVAMAEPPTAEPADAAATPLAADVAKLRLDAVAAVAPTSTQALRGEEAVPTICSYLPNPKGADKGAQQVTELAQDVMVSVFVHTNEAARAALPLLKGTVRRGTLATATLPLSRLPELLASDAVTHVEAGEPLSMPLPLDTAESVEAPDRSLRDFGTEEEHRYGEGVLIGIIDVGGFDVAHPDFLSPDGTTRFVRIWDQGGAGRPPPKAPLDYGAEFHQEHLNAALNDAPGLGVSPHDLERQSQQTPSSHGTHVASIAAGNAGICRKAKIAGVLIALTDDDLNRRRSFYDSTRVAHAVDYLMEAARTLGCTAVSINISLGTNGHAHDASSAISRWIDAALAVPGRCVSVAAGNAGQEMAEHEGDMGYVMGRIHTSGRVPSGDLDADVEWVVIGNGIADISENELEIWYAPQDRFAVSVKPPDSRKWIGPVEPREFIETLFLPDGGVLSVYNDLYHPANGSNVITVFLSPRLEDPLVSVPAGQWTVRLHGRQVRDGRFHGWIERDDPRRHGRVGDRATWNFPSFFSERSNVDDTSVSSLACGQRIVSVANLDETAERIHITSSQGPTRDNRSKPDVAAPGTNVVAAKGFAGLNDLWVGKTGTSMASPYVAGIAGLMLAICPELTSAQIEGIIHRTSRPLPGEDFTWRNRAGFGRIDPARCLEEALATKRGTRDRTKEFPL